MPFGCHENAINTQSFKRSAHPGDENILPHALDWPGSLPGGVFPAHQLGVIAPAKARESGATHT
jgi:hypothetical protein